MYFRKQYNMYIETNDQDIYGEKLIKMSTPQYYVFYNGEKNRPDRIELKLSDAFQKNLASSGFECTATMLNINLGYNKELLDSCQSLREYAIQVLPNITMTRFMNSKKSIKCAALSYFHDRTDELGNLRGCRVND